MLGLQKTQIDNLQELKKDFWAKGYMVVPNILPEEVINNMFSEIEALFGEALSQHGVDADRFAAFATLDEKYAYLKKNHPKIKSHAYDLIKFLGSLHRAANSPTITNIVQQLVGSPVLLDAVQVRIDDKDDDRLLPLHQEACGQISELCVTAWIPLVDVNPQNGAMRYIPESHKNGFLPHRFYPEYKNYHGVKEGFYDEGKAIYGSIKKGTAIIFHPLLIHGSSPNKTDRTRWTFITRYNSVKQIGYLASESAPLRPEQKES